MQRVAIVLGVLVADCGCGFALNPSLDVSQYAHNAWTIRVGFFRGNIYAIAQTPDGYLWLGTEFGLFRFDGVRIIPCPPKRYPIPPRDDGGRIWASTRQGLAYLKNGRSVAVNAVRGARVHFITGDRAVA